MTTPMSTLYGDTFLTTGMVTAMNATAETVLHKSNSLAVILESSTLALIMAIAIVANLVAMVTIFRVPMLRKNPHNILIVNLTLDDLGVALTSMVFSMISVFDDGRLLKTYPVLCDFNGYCTVLFSASSFATITCIAIDRYLSVVWSTRFPPSHRRSCIMVVGIWIFSASYAALPLVHFLSSFSYLDGTHHCSPIWENCFFYVVGFMVNYVVTIPIMFLCYVFVFRVIWKKQVKLSEYQAAAKNLTYSQQSFDDTIGESGSKTGQSVSFALVPPSSGMSTSSDEIKERNGVARMSKSLSMPQLDVLGSEECSSVDLKTYDRCTGDCHLRGYHNCERCRSLLIEQIRGCTANQENGRERPVQRSASTVGPSRRKSKRGQSRGRSCSTDRQLSTSRSFGRTDVEVRKPRKVSRSLDRSGSFFSLSSLRRKSFGLKRNTTGKATKEQRKMYRKRMKKLTADKQVALTGSFLILSSLICWLPYAITRSCFFPVDTKHWVEVTAMWISFVNAFLDPVIYAFMNRRVKAKIREDFRAIRRCIRSCGRNDLEEDDS
ncbi:histamine H1 receptor-like [Lytechinus variegatus]|uniref:histamine H1 receptor-like n=2 Tax=Lytechinus variegatus TaxID=7654 RepID=UPI001BB158D4|nr:histamine H1 receptor-like [Lytechinus variegatus]